MSVSIASPPMSRLAYYLVLTTGLFQLQEGVNGEEHQKIDSEVKRQDEIKLRCAYPKTSKMIQLSWERNVNGMKQNIAVYHPQYGESIPPAYNQTVTFLSAITSGDIKLKASAVDEGIYQCSINTFPDGIFLKKIAVVNPAKFSRFRAADTHVQLVPGSNMTLSCGNPNGSRVQQVTWKRVTEDEINTIVKLEQLSPFIGYDYKSRIEYSSFLFANLTIWNVTEDDMGRYYCKVTVNNRSWTKAFNIGAEKDQSDITSSRPHVTFQEIVEGPSYPTKIDFNLFLIIGAVISGILLLIISCVVCVYRRKWRRDKRQLKSKSSQQNQQRRSNQNSYAFAAVSNQISSRPAQDQRQDIYANMPHPTQKGRPRTNQWRQ